MCARLEVGEVSYGGMSSIEFDVCACGQSSSSATFTARSDMHGSVRARMEAACAAACGIAWSRSREYVSVCVVRHHNLLADITGQSC